MTLETVVWYALLRVCAKFGENRAIGGAMTTLYCIWKAAFDFERHYAFYHAALETIQRSNRRD